MICNVCNTTDGPDNLKSLEIMWRRRKMQLYFCDNCIGRADLFQGATPSELIAGDVKPPPHLETLFHQYLTLTHSRGVSDISYDVFVTQKCTICQKDGFNIAIETKIEGVQVLLRFCGKCAEKPNIFLDHTPFKVFHEKPSVALFATPKLVRYMAHNPTSIPWNEFK